VSTVSVNHPRLWCRRDSPDDREIVTFAGERARRVALIIEPMPRHGVCPFNPFMTHRYTLAILLVLCLGPFSTVSAQSPRAYNVEDLGTLGGNGLYGSAMNSNGDIAGWGTLPDGTLHAFRWTRSGGLEDLGVNGGVQSQAADINDRGDVVGVYFDQAYVAHNFIAPRGGVMQDLSAEIFQVSSISNDGWLTGYTWNGRAFRAVVGGAIQEIAQSISFGTAINEHGDCTGWTFLALTPDGQPTAFRYSDATGWVDLGTLGGASSYGYAINNGGVIVGTAARASEPPHAFRARLGGPLEDLGVLPGPPLSGSSALAINDAGDIVGFSDATASYTAFRYTDAEGMIDLALRIPIAARLKGQLYSGFAINAANQIAALYNGPAGDLRTEVFTPVEVTPPPGIVYLEVEPSATLWPPNGRMVPIWVNAAATDEYDVAPVCRIASVTNSEGPRVGPDPDVQITGLLSVNLRAKRRGDDHDRKYTLNVACANYFGNVTTAQVVVRVPHDHER
jgi:probable HAF family extracellular repeat protein